MYSIGHWSFVGWDTNANYPLGSKKKTKNITPNLFSNRNYNVGQVSDSSNRFNYENFFSLEVKINNYVSPNSIKEPW